MTQLVSKASNAAARDKLERCITNGAGANPSTQASERPTIVSGHQTGTSCDLRDHCAP